MENAADMLEMKWEFVLLLRNNDARCLPGTDNYGTIPPELPLINRSTGDHHV
jgi:hypothetical protein